MSQTPVSEIQGQVYRIGEPVSRARTLALNRTIETGRALPLIPRLDAASQTLREAVSKLAARTRAGETLPEQGVWLVENWRFIVSEIRDVRKILKKIRLSRLPLAADGPLFGYARAYEIALEIVADGAYATLFEKTANFLTDYQSVTPLMMAELWSLDTLIRLALIEELARSASGERPSASALAPSVLITMMREAGDILWQELIEEQSRTEQILREDPAGVYSRMDFHTRDQYRHEVAEIAHRSPASEEEVARAAITLAREAARHVGAEARDAHVGFHLIGRGAPRLKAGLQHRPSLHNRISDLILEWPTAWYLIGIELVTLLLAAFLLSRLPAHLPHLGLILFLLATEPAIGFMNQLSMFIVRPRRLPKLDFAEGIPSSCKTMVVVPTLLLSEKFVEKLLADLEVRFLANRDPQLTFALLTDLPDAVDPVEDDTVVELAASGIRLLNERYASESRQPFYLFHRRREWNPQQGAWMGWERKRGKLIALNNLLRGEDDAFPVKIGDLSVLPLMRYVITLDSDTELPRGSAQQLIGTMAHPLNRAVIDPVMNVVTEGYGILQPRVGISVSSSRRSRLARIYSGQTGFDLYTTAVSDVYQDLFGEGSYTGKGIYDVDIFQKTLAKRFPHDILLSHDLVEGTHARAGLATDIELIDDYPSHYTAWSKRKHRWVRGDWQIMQWLLPRVPDYHGKMVPNPLSVISLWKILDNLRRSLLEPCMFLLLVAGWTFLPGGALYWTGAVALVTLLPVFVSGAFSLLKTPFNERWWAHLRESASGFVSGIVEVALRFIFLAHQTGLMVDAILRSVIRTTVTGRRLLEWESAAQAEFGKARPFGSIQSYLWLASPVTLGIGFLVAKINPAALPVAFPLIAVWTLSPLVALWLNSTIATRKERTRADDKPFLREAALRTWQFFDEYANESENWLIPDTVHEEDGFVAHRTSPTNIGLLLNAQLAACDFGFQSPRRAIDRTAKILGTLSRMERHRGHFLNWYDTKTLAALKPRFVSTVDSGNFAASLIATRQGLLEMIERPVIGEEVMRAIADHCRAIHQACPASQTVARLHAATIQTPGSLVEWLNFLRAASAFARQIEEECDSAESLFWSERLTQFLRDTEREIEETAPLTAIGEFAKPPALGQLPGLYDKLLSRREFEGNQELLAARERAILTLRQANSLAHQVSEWIAEMDFRFLFDTRRKLFHVGFNVEAGAVDPHRYDLLASEARTASFIAIAKSDVSQENWVRLSRSLVRVNRRRVLVSWSGTMFEYLMPLLWMANRPNTVLDQAVRGAVHHQRMFAAARRVSSWGISESACSDRLETGEYRYHAFGVPELALDPPKDHKLVIAPYASVLALMVYPRVAASNLRRQSERGWLTRYGFYEAVDCSDGQEYVVRSFMAHHQGMSLVALDNALNGRAMQMRFHAEPMVQATELILEERLPLAARVETALAPAHILPPVPEQKRAAA